VCVCVRMCEGACVRACECVCILILVIKMNYQKHVAKILRMLMLLSVPEDAVGAWVGASAPSPGLMAVAASALTSARASGTYTHNSLYTPIRQDR
jgi:hypothetical protein